MNNTTWKSIYIYGDNQESIHMVVFSEAEGAIVGKSVPQTDESQLSFQLQLEPETNILTGTWQEHTSKEGVYSGINFHGAVQFILNPDMKRADGAWVGFNSEQTKINTGSWILKLTHEN